MASVTNFLAPGKTAFTSSNITQTTLYGLADPSQPYVGTAILMLSATTTLAGGTVTVQGLIDTVDGAANTDGVTPLGLPYVGRVVNGAADTSGALITTVLTPASGTSNSIVLIPATGLLPVLSITSITAGTLSIYWTPRVGAAV